MSEKTRWVVCQIGAREHYAVARSLHRNGLLEQLITDIWVPPGTIFSCLPGRVGKRLRERYHPDLGKARVTNFTIRSIGRGLIKATSGPRFQWDGMINQNRWFQSQAVRSLKASEAFRTKHAQFALLAYSYAAHDILAFARDAGARTILAQIDGGEVDEARIASLWSKRWNIMPDRPPNTYWETWREECRIADHILVNSEWSQQLLVQAGVDSRKLKVVPVIYEGNRCKMTTRQYPLTFDKKRPLIVLFLGTLTLRKGMIETIDAARVLLRDPVHFIFVGSDPEGNMTTVKQEPNVTWHDRVPRSQVVQFYRDADVLLFPTHSDGFGMVQIEALESGLPVIASRNCAAIIEHGKTGLLLDQVTSEEIVRAIRQCVMAPEKLASMSAAATAGGAAFACQSATAFLNAIQAIATRKSQ
jgi:glycosyltransferase involved in cell wall biosynthesis